MRDAPKPPEILDKIVDVVLAHRPKAKSSGAKKRKRKTSPIAATPAAKQEDQPLKRPHR
jgi:hypothetical protein